MEPPLHPAGFAELLVHMRYLATDRHQNLCQDPKTAKQAQVLKQQR